MLLHIFLSSEEALYAFAYTYYILQYVITQLLPSKFR